MAARIVATVLSRVGRPPKARIAGLTTMRYAMVTNVVTPPRISTRAVVRRRSSAKSRSSIAAIEDESKAARTNGWDRDAPGR